MKESILLFIWLLKTFQPQLNCTIFCICEQKYYSLYMIMINSVCECVCAFLCTLKFKSNQIKFALKIEGNKNKKEQHLNVQVNWQFTINEMECIWVDNERLCTRKTNFCCQFFLLIYFLQNAKEATRLNDITSRTSTVCTQKCLFLCFSMLQTQKNESFHQQKDFYYAIAILLLRTLGAEN